MRVALAQLQAGNNGGAAGLQALIAAIDRAASGETEPDVIILPGGCDTGGRQSTLRVAGRFSTFSETVGWKARDWGVYIVACLHVNMGGKARACSLLFDPDGDIVLRTEPTRDGSVDEGNGRRWFASPIGWIGLVDPQADVSEMGIPKENGLLAISSFTGRRSPNSESRTLKEREASGTGLHVGVAGWAGASGIDRASTGARTFVCTPDGTRVAAAAAAEDCIVYVNIELQPPTNMGELVDRHAG